MANNNPAHIVLTNVRLSYAHLDKPYSNNGGEPKYSATILVPKTDPANRQKIDAAIRAATARMREKKGNSFPATPKTSVHDGDGVRPSDGQPFGDECKGCWVFTASSKTPVSYTHLDVYKRQIQLCVGLYHTAYLFDPPSCANRWANFYYKLCRIANFTRLIAGTQCCRNTAERHFIGCAHSFYR